MSKRRTAMFAAKKARKEQGQLSPGHKSRYAKKKAYLTKHGGWGFDYPEPKPWK